MVFKGVVNCSRTFLFNYSLKLMSKNLLIRGGYELESLDSKSRVLTITPWRLVDKPDWLLKYLDRSQVYFYYRE